MTKIMKIVSKNKAKRYRMLEILFRKIVYLFRRDTIFVVKLQNKLIKVYFELQKVKTF